MTISPDLLLAILSMDSYNRGYGVGINGLSESGEIGNVQVIARSDIFGGQADSVFQTWQQSELR